MAAYLVRSLVLALSIVLGILLVIFAIQEIRPDKPVERLLTSPDGRELKHANITPGQHSAPNDGASTKSSASANKRP